MSSNPAGIRKRRRKVWSCAECRRRKLQCDRAQPNCSRCVASGSSCSYTGDPFASERSNGNVSHRSISVASHSPTRITSSDHFEQRLRNLESKLSDNSALDAHIGQYVPGVGPAVRVSTPQTLNKQDIINLNLRCGAFNTEFYGHTCTGSIIPLIPELVNFAKDAFNKAPAISAILKETHIVEMKALNQTRLSRQVSEQELKAMLPTRAEADILVQVFFDNFDSIYHIVHRPHFDQEYNRLWMHDIVDVHFLVLVLLIVSVALCLVSSPSSSTSPNRTVIPRERATQIIQSCEIWLGANVQPFDKLIDFQISFMLVFAKQLNARRCKRTWINSGKVLRDFMRAGFHRDPGHLREVVSPIEQELRRRLWTAAAEFELQASFEQGMIATSWPLQSDVSSPKNISDDDLDRDPRLQSSSSFTTSSYLTFASKSTVFRHELNSLLNDIRHTFDFDETKTLTEQVYQHIKDIPSWTKSGSHAPHALLRLNLYQYLLVLHLRQARQSESSVEVGFSHMIIVETAVKIIDIHKSLLDQGTHALELLCSHATRASMMICYVYCTRQANSIESILVPQMTSHMQQAVSMIKQKAKRFVGDQRHLWISIAAESFMHLQIKPSERLQYMLNAVEDFQSIFRDPKMNAADNNISITDHGQYPTPIGSESMGLGQAPVTGMTEDMSGQITDVPLIPLGLMENWLLDGGLFDDWTFDDWRVTNEAI